MKLHTDADVVVQFPVSVSSSAAGRGGGGEGGGSDTHTDTRSPPLGMRVAFLPFARFPRCNSSLFRQLQRQQRHKQPCVAHVTDAASHTGGAKSLALRDLGITSVKLKPAPLPAQWVEVK